MAKAQAAAQLAKVYGVTTAFGNETVTKYPPERSYPVLQDGTGGGHDYVYRQATEAVKTATGKEIPAADIALLPLPHDTAQAFAAGKPAPYRLAYVDHSKQPPSLEYIYGSTGRAAFVADPVEAQKAITEGRAAAFREKQGFLDPNAPEYQQKPKTAADYPAGSPEQRKGFADQDNADRAAERAQLKKMQAEADAPFKQVEVDRKAAQGGPDYVPVEQSDIPAGPTPKERIKRDYGTFRQNFKKMQRNPAPD
ncbi:MAG: hypothetical protein ACRED3_21280 [Bradyrhizobium sp.]